MMITYENSQAERFYGSAITRVLGRLLRIVTIRVTEKKNRKGLSALTDLDDRMLRDLGVTRDEVRWAIQQPLGIDAGAELTRSARANRTKF